MKTLKMAIGDLYTLSNENEAPVAIVANYELATESLPARTKLATLDNGNPISLWVDTVKLQKPSKAQLQHGMFELLNTLARKQL